MFWKKKSTPSPPPASENNLLVIGGTGRIGSEVIRQALKRGYNVRAITRDLSKSKNFEEGLVEWQQCDATNKACMQKAAEDRGVIISAMKPEDRALDKTFCDSYRILVEVMKEKKVPRLLSVTCDWENPSNSWFFRNILRRYYRNFRSDMMRMENMIEMRPKDDIKWTVVRTFKIVPNPYTGKFRVGPSEMEPPFIPVTYTGDLASFLLDEAKQRNWVYKIIALGQ